MSDWFWLLAILVTSVNAGILYARSRSPVAADPSLAPGYRTLILGYLVYLNLPWLVMGIGGAPTADYVRPSLGQPVVVAFHASIVLVWIVLTAWVFRGGAEILVTHPGAMRVYGYSAPDAHLEAWKEIAAAERPPRGTLPYLVDFSLEPD